MTAEEIYELAHATAYNALAPHTKQVGGRQVIAEAMAAYVIGDGQGRRERWAAIGADNDRRRLVTNALLRDLARQPGVAIPPANVLDSLIGVVASALLAADAGRQVLTSADTRE